MRKQSTVEKHENINIYRNIPLNEYLEIEMIDSIGGGGGGGGLTYINTSRIDKKSLADLYHKRLGEIKLEEYSGTRSTITCVTVLFNFESLNFNCHPYSGITSKAGFELCETAI